MQKEFWLERWQRKEIGFHRDDFNPFLVRYWGQLKLPKDGEVFVPLCGKSRDMLWLKSQGYRVLGVELSELAVEAFFRENNLKPRKSKHKDFMVYEADSIRILCGDFFKTEAGQLKDVRGAFDRGALTALPEKMRKDYAAHLLDILPPGTSILLITMDYPAAQMSGPPFPVTLQEAEALLGKNATVRLLESPDVLADNQNLAARGLTNLHENVFMVNVKA